MRCQLWEEPAQAPLGDGAALAYSRGRGRGVAGVTISVDGERDPLARLSLDLERSRAGLVVRIACGEG